VRRERISASLIDKEKAQGLQLTFYLPPLPVELCVIGFSLPLQLQNQGVPLRAGGPQGLDGNASLD
jgi:hypothetical protein